MVKNSGCFRTICRWFTVLVNSRLWPLGIVSMIILVVVVYQHAILNSCDQRRETNNPMDREREMRLIHKEMDTIKVTLVQPTNSTLVDHIKRYGNLTDSQIDNEIDIPNGKDIVKLQPKENNSLEKKYSHKRLTDHQMINILCDMYRRNVVTGSMCHQLCNSKTIGISVEHRDIGYKSTKRVYMLNCKECLPDRRITSLVMKLFWRPDWENEINTEIRKHKTLQSYEKYLNTELNEYATMYGRILTRTENTLFIFWGEKLDRDANETDRLSVLRSIDGLRRGRVLFMQGRVVQDTNDEYLSLRFFQKLPIIPRFYGTCGPAYFVERAPTLNDLGYMDDRASPPLSWIRVVEISLKLLQIAKDTDNASEQGLALCDFKTQHFGLTNDDRMVITDLDHLKYSGLFRSALTRRPLQRKCIRDSQCNEWACNRECNLQTKTCGLAWTNNNLQVNNALPSCVKEAGTLSEFKRKLKTFYFQQAF